MPRFLSQLIAVTATAIRTIPQRKGASAAAAFGIAGVVCVFVSVLSIAEGMRRTMANSAAPANVLVLRDGANTEMVSGLQGEEVKIIAEAPGLLQGDEGGLASPELFVIVNLPKRATGTDANVPLRGVGRNAMQVREDFRIVEGRMFEWGLKEAIAGVGAAREFEGIEAGGTVLLGSEEWPVVGIFETGGGMSESEIWCDSAVLQSAYRRGNTYQSVYAKLETPDSLSEFKDSLTTDPRLSVQVLREDEYHFEQSKLLRSIIVGLGTIIAALMGLGAIFGALNTMYTAVSSRTVEIATLRALGFGAVPVVFSVLAESLLLALGGGILGGGLAWLAFDEFRAATLNWSSFSQMTFAFDVTPSLLAQGIFYALVLGLVGGLLPAIRAARLPIADALRER